MASDIDRWLRLDNFPGRRPASLMIVCVTIVERIAKNRKMPPLVSLIIPTPAAE